MSDVWITGVGTINPLGTTLHETGQRLLAGHTGIRSVSLFDTSEHECRIAGEVPYIPVPDLFTEEDFRSRQRVEQMLLWCAASALKDGQCWDQRKDLRIGLILGQGAEWPLLWEQRQMEGMSSLDPSLSTVVPLASRLQESLHLRGPTITVAAACASANHAIDQARCWVEQGWVDLCIAGGVEAGLTPLSLASFGNLRALSRRNDSPRQASRPFDRGRDGFVIGEGGALFVLESEERARKRGANPYACLAGFGASSDAFHMIIPSDNPEPASRAMRRAMKSASINPEEIGYINAHATSTPIGDICESRVLHQVLGEEVTHVAVSSTKGSTGHLLSGAAGMEAVACLVAIQSQAIPPTINLEDPDPECDLDHVANEAQARRVDVALSNSFGFGGSNTCLVLKKVA